MYSILSFSVLLTVFCCVLCSNEDVHKVNQKYEENINSREEKQLQESFEQEVITTSNYSLIEKLYSSCLISTMQFYDVYQSLHAR